MERKDLKIHLVMEVSDDKKTEVFKSSIFHFHFIYFTTHVTK